MAASVDACQLSGSAGSFRGGGGSIVADSNSVVAARSMVYFVIQILAVVVVVQIDTVTVVGIDLTGQR